jgi:hypothetical protein
MVAGILPVPTRQPANHRIGVDPDQPRAQAKNAGRSGRQSTKRRQGCNKRN